MPRRNSNTDTVLQRRRAAHRWPQCPETGKIRLRERKDVRLALKDIRMQRQLARVNGHESTRNECRGYKCTACEGWHLTSMPSWAAPARAGR